MALLPINPESIDLNTILDILGTPTPETPTQTNPNILPEVPQKINLIKITGKIVDSISSEPINGVRILSPLKKPTKTNIKGEFKIKIPEIVNTPLSPESFQIHILGKKNEYSSFKIIPYNSSKEIKINLGIIPLKPLKSDLNQELIELLSFSDVEIKQYASKEITFEYIIQKRLNISINDLKKLVIPMILGLISQYGISKIQEKLTEIKINGGELTTDIITQISCPTPYTLSNIISSKNQLTSKINNTLKIIQTAGRSIEINDALTQPLNNAYQILKNIPLPSAVAGVGIPVSVINNIQDVKNFLNINIEKIKQGSSSLSSIIEVLISVLEQVLSILSLLDKITEYCTQDSNLDPEQSNRISEELITLTNQQTLQENPIITNVNGFEIEIETENTTKTLKRRRATARNKQGIVMLKGEWSFSSISQILIDELVFYIQTNDLKAD